MFNITRLQFAMQRRGISKSLLAKELGVSPKTIHNYLNAVTVPSDYSKLSKVLNFPEAFFEGDDLPEIGDHEASFRSMSRMSAKLRGIALTYGVTGFLLNDWIEEEFSVPQATLPDYSESMKSPEQAAYDLRHEWGLGDAPIDNLTRLLEAKGIRVFSLSLEAKEVDAFSVWNNNRPFMFLNTMKSAERSRFDAAHELGHLVMHTHSMKHGTLEIDEEAESDHKKPKRDIEKEANQFAAAFLMPETRLLAYKHVQPTINNLLRIKAELGVSCVAVGYRMFQLGYISEWIYTRVLCPQFAKLKYRTNEPNPMDREKSVVLAKIFKTLREDGVSTEDIAKELNVDANDIFHLTYQLANVESKYHLKIAK